MRRLIDRTLVVLFCPLFLLGYLYEMAIVWFAVGQDSARNADLGRPAQYPCEVTLGPDGRFRHTRKEARNGFL